LLGAATLKTFTNISYEDRQIGIKIEKVDKKPASLL
jgi:hypothetical protein